MKTFAAPLWFRLTCLPEPSEPLGEFSQTQIAEWTANARRAKRRERRAAFWAAMRGLPPVLVQGQ